MLSELQERYDQHRFLDVWESTAGWWKPATDLDQFSTEELVFAARLAQRLGGFRLSRSLLWKVRKIEPEKPLVRYFTNHLQVPRQLLLDDLTAFEANPDLGGEDDELRANWLASHAYSWAKLRNMKRAKDLLQQAHILSPGSAWIYSLEADVFGLADDWAESLRSSERAWELDSFSSWANTSLATALMNLGDIQEAIRRLEIATGDTQSAQLLQTACWYQCAVAELQEGVERIETLAKARALALRIECLAPLADKEFKASLARTWLDIAQLGGDHAEMEQWAREARSPFHRQILTNLRQNPNGKRIRLPYHRTLQKHQECVPTSVGSALSATGIEISIEELATDVTFGGTAEWAAADWLRDKGLYVRFFDVTKEIAIRLIEASIGFVVSWEHDDGGHAIAIVGIDHAAGIALAHDPSSFRTSEYLLTVLDESRGPLGVLGMVAVTSDRVSELDQLLPTDADVVEASQAHQKAMTLYGPSAAQRVVAELTERFPSHPGTQYLQALQDLEEGRAGRALTSFRELMGRYPNAPRVRLHLMGACRAIGNTALLRQTLQVIVEMGVVPGVESHGDWIRPHPRYTCDYADILRASSETRRYAEALLRSALRTDWSSAYAWHVLADLRWGMQQLGSALIAYSVASFLGAHNEHYARAYVDVLSHSQRMQEGLQWLEDRVQHFGGSPQGISAWITWISVLEERGYPERALSACRQALERHKTTPFLLAFAVPFFARMGLWDEAETQLDALAKTENNGAFHEAAVSFYRMCGKPTKALEHAEFWVREVPRSMQARYALLSELSTLEGQELAAGRAEEWMREHPANEEFEEAFCQYAQDQFHWKKVLVLRRRAKRNPEDGWAWAELVFSVLTVFERGDEKLRNRLTSRIEAYLAELDRVAGNDSVALRAHGLWKEDCGEWRAAVDRYLDAIRHQPDHFYAYRRAWECAARLTDVERRNLWAAIEPLYLGNSSNLTNSLEMIGLLAGRFGVRETEQIVARWQLQRPDDPNVLEAAADLLLNHGHGLSDAKRALALLRTAVVRFPYHAGLRFSLARACRAVGDYQGANEAFEELVRRRPDDNSALIQLAWIQQRESKTELALQTLDRAKEQEPQEWNPYDSQTQILIECDRFEEARLTLQAALSRIPRSVRMYERTIALYTQCGLPEQALEAGRQGTRAYPRGAYLWLILGRALQDAPKLAAPGEAEVCLRQSIKCNHSLYESVDWLAMFLVERRRYQEAIDILLDVEPKLADPSPARGRIAWVRRQSGEKSQAVTDLAAIVRDTPWYAWGWNLMLAWLEEDKNWQLCEEILETVPSLMLTDVSFRRKRLSLLKQTKVMPAKIDAEWADLIRDFPEDVSLHLSRYDSLVEEGRLSDAAAVLQLIAATAGNNVYFLARLVAVECREKKLSEALDHALTVCFAKTEESLWATNQVWDQMGNAGMTEKLSVRFDLRLQEGAQPARRALVLYAEHILSSKSGPRIPSWLRRSWLNEATRRIKSLLLLVEGSSWEEGAELADLMSVLNRNNYRRLVIACWNRMRDKGLNANTDAWAQAGLAMINYGRKRTARRVMQDWRARTGIGMWMLSNYLLCVPRLRQTDLKEVIVTCEDGLTRLPHDHCARYLAYMEAEAYALIGDNPGLTAAWAKYTRYFEGVPEKGEYFPVWQEYLRADLPTLVSLLGLPGRPGYRRITWKLRFQRVWNPTTRKRCRKILVLLLRIGIALWLVGRSLVSFFK